MTTLNAWNSYIRLGSAFKFWIFTESYYKLYITKCLKILNIQNCKYNKFNSLNQDLEGESHQIYYAWIKYVYNDLELGAISF